MSDRNTQRQSREPNAGSLLRCVSALDDVIDRLERAWLPVELNQHPEFYDYIPTPIDAYMAGMEAVCRSAPGKRYLEVGCGIGTKLIIASRLGFEVHAIENREQYVAIARYLCPEATIEVADARGYGRYGLFDVVFCYRPIISEEGQTALERFLTQQMRQDAILFLPFRNIHHLGWQLFDPSVPYVWRRS